MKINSDLKIENTDYSVKDIVDKLTSTQKKVSSLTKYSSKEQKTGEIWVNGKPIYRRIFSGNTTSTAGTSSNLAKTSVGNLGGDYTEIIIVNISGTIMSNSHNTFTISSPVLSGAGTYPVILNTGEIQIRACSGNFTNMPYTLIIDYIKASDEEEEEL